MLSRRDHRRVPAGKCGHARRAARLKPDTFEDIIALVALYRPGPMDNIPSYIACKHGREEAGLSASETLEPVLRKPSAVMIYQEQVMQIAQVLSGYTLGNADLAAPGDGQEDPGRDGRPAPRLRRGCRANGRARKARRYL